MMPPLEWVLFTVSVYAVVLLLVGIALAIFGLPNWLLWGNAAPLAINGGDTWFRLPPRRAWANSDAGRAALLKESAAAAAEATVPHHWHWPKRS